MLLKSMSTIKAWGDDGQWFLQYQSNKFESNLFL